MISAIAITSLASFLCTVAMAEESRLTDLRCEDLANPLGIDIAQPRLSWVAKSDQRGLKQTAYRVLGASSLEQLAKNRADLWDSGKVNSSHSLHVIYDGEKLESRSTYFWKVMLFDKNGASSAWSNPETFGTGIFPQDQWTGQWIQSDLELYEYQKELKKVADHNMESEYDMRQQAKKVHPMTRAISKAPAVWLRKQFSADEGQPIRATLLISGLGLYEAYLNGSKINDHLLTVSPYDFDKTVPYHAYDVTDRLMKGENALGVILGNGYFNPVIPSLLREYAADFINTPRLKCDLAWKIATQETYPSWYDMIYNKKNTCFKENWQGGLVQMPSLAGPIGAWFYRSLGGIRPDEPGFKSFIVAPYTKTLDWVKCAYMSPYGKIVSNWSKKNGTLTMHITVPANTTATVHVPGKNITEGGSPAAKASDVTFLRTDNGKSVYKVSSGTYKFVSTETQD